jgi:hypothetical protein
MAARLQAKSNSCRSFDGRVSASSKVSLFAHKTLPTTPNANPTQKRSLANMRAKPTPIKKAASVGGLFQSGVVHTPIAKTEI